MPRSSRSLVHSRFINLYGQADGARLARNQSTEPGRDQRICRPIRAAFMLLLCQPYRELEELRSLWVDNIVYTEHWRTFVESRMQEWQSVSLMVCVPDTFVKERGFNWYKIYNAVCNPLAVRLFVICYFIFPLALVNMTLMLLRCLTASTPHSSFISLNNQCIAAGRLRFLGKALSIYQG